MCYWNELACTRTLRTDQAKGISRTNFPPFRKQDLPPFSSKKLISALLVKPGYWWIQLNILHFLSSLNKKRKCLSDLKCYLKFNQLITWRNKFCHKANVWGKHKLRFFSCLNNELTKILSNSLDIKPLKTGFPPKIPVVYVTFIKSFWETAAAKNSELLTTKTIIEVLKNPMDFCFWLRIGVFLLLPLSQQRFM